ncbi:MAG: hypothetical protein A2351_03365 [Omnitrophica bacterium RIFOXYB12_FULL_50_7]|nr:MAG: hypothetical protein A2351_03365 [Omnitrophica bacterium RIFOXYB12_FULL_50_7]
MFRLLEFDSFLGCFRISKTPWQKTVERRGGLTTGLAGAFVFTELHLAQLPSFLKILFFVTVLLEFPDNVRLFLGEFGAVFF